MTDKLHIPNNWTFKSENVAANFDAHVREQLPWYDMVTMAIQHIARHYIPEGGIVYDIGASTGNIGRALSATLTERNATLYGLENSKEMCAKYDAPGYILNENALSHVYEPFDFAVCYLVLMFMPYGQRAQLIQRLRERLNPGGAIVIVDKCEAETGYPATLFWRLTLAGKVQAGADPKHIIEKELSLAGVQRPIDPAIIGDGILWFRFGEFAGWLITA